MKNVQFKGSQPMRVQKLKKQFSILLCDFFKLQKKSYFKDGDDE